MRYGPGMQTRTLTFFFELVKEPEFLEFFLLVPWITSASSTHPSPVLLFSFSSQHYPRTNILLKRTFFLAPFEVFPSLFPHIPALFPHDVFMRQCCINNTKVLPHVKDHHVSQASLLLKKGTMQWSLQSSCYFLQPAGIHLRRFLQLWGCPSRIECRRAGSSTQSFEILYHIRHDLSKDFLKPCKWQDIIHTMNCCWRT